MSVNDDNTEVPPNAEHFADVFKSPGMYHLWDLPGADQFESLREEYYPYGDVFSIAYNVTNRKSFENVRTWVQKIRRYNTGARLELVGYKCDLVDQIVVSDAEDHRLARELGLHSSTRMSTKTGENHFTMHY
ncbi:P-loop containing nucleoside triphosphate hydrolase protein [Artomyces pyxidatus]|uniref:P-loop containing nucleoside triphosphate hydrolase protein n=1 Tax=Artomyces pyxidatus TaxID=48021 RepID=A0ACB8SZZ4_9AGAM|nr:P-loop containing nucleoside triphosphate hydrolase protein [Artomyces pyxidatus]